MKDRSCISHYILSYFIMNRGTKGSVQIIQVCGNYILQKHENLILIMAEDIKLQCISLLQKHFKFINSSTPG